MLFRKSPPTDEGPGASNMATQGATSQLYVDNGNFAMALLSYFVVGRILPSFVTYQAHVLCQVGAFFPADSDYLDAGIPQKPGAVLCAPIYYRVLHMSGHNSHQGAIQLPL
jgi:hypothetical protein